ncbi:retrovirus-related pol polyprotein from transposon TNT 1-94 [Tanacetum coccineum]
MTPVTISSGLVPNPPPSTLFIPPSRTDWDILFQPMFDELLTPPPSVDYVATEVIALIHEVVAPVPQFLLRELIFEETFALVARFRGYKDFLALPLIIKWSVNQMDVTTSISECIYEKSLCKPDRNFVAPDNLNHMYKQKIALYGLKQAPHTWYDMFFFVPDIPLTSPKLSGPTLYHPHCADADHAVAKIHIVAHLGSNHFLEIDIVGLSSKRQKSTAISSTN